MIFADKLIQLRKKSGMSQEELAEHMQVSRQSVSKWEGAQSIPDMNKMIQMSNLFEVSLDYLMKDEVEEQKTEIPTEKTETRRQVSMEEANGFLEIKERTARPMAWATFLCILSPICLLMLGAMSEIPTFGISANVAGGVGIMILLLFVLAAVVIFISIGNKTARYEYLKKEEFETMYGVTGMVKERQEKYRDTYNRSNIIGTCLCILAVFPIFAGMIVGGESDLFMVGMVCLLLLLIGIGVILFVRVGVVWESFDTLLQEGDYSREKKKQQSLVSAISGAYWLIATAIYLAYSFGTNLWDETWIVWPVAGVLYAAVITIVRSVKK